MCFWFGVFYRRVFFCFRLVGRSCGGLVIRERLVKIRVGFVGLGGMVGFVWLGV